MKSRNNKFVRCRLMLNSAFKVRVKCHIIDGHKVNNHRYGHFQNIIKIVGLIYKSLNACLSLKIERLHYSKFVLINNWKGRNVKFTDTI